MAKRARADANGRLKSTRSTVKSTATRRRVLEAGARILMERGYAATRLSDIGDLAELQAGSLYYYFGSKEELVEEVVRYGVQFTHAYVRTAVDQLPESATPGERLTAAVNAHLEAMLEIGDFGPAHVRTFAQLPPDMQERLRPLRRAFGRFWEELIQDAIDAGDVRDDIDPYLLQLFITNALERVPEWRLRTRQSAGDLSMVVNKLIFDGLHNTAARTKVGARRQPG
jgi:TetR/AcrR family transcriptional regulator, cholesterol catabolism regulator